jgi:type VI secretion system secreted protein VgrG
VNTFTKNDWKNHICHDRHDTIDHFTYLETKGETHETFREQRKTELFANDNRTVHGDNRLAVGKKCLVNADDEIHVKSGMKVVLEAGSELTIKAGGQWIRLDPSGIKTSASIAIGAGHPGDGSGTVPELPDVSQKVASSKTPIFISVTYAERQREAMEKAAKNHSVFCPVCG